MKICFISNYFNHHQTDFCDELAKLAGPNNFYFIQENKLPSFRKKLGYESNIGKRDFVIIASENKQLAQAIISESKIIINTQALGDRYIKPEKKNNKIIFWYNERIYKETNPIKIVLKTIRAKKWFSACSSKQYCLCASSYCKKDLMYISPRIFKNSCFKWGYFPHVKPEEVNTKSSDVFNLLFVGRLIEWKHPKIAIYIANYLKQKHIKYRINIIGDGNQKSKIKKLIKKDHLQNNVSILGPIKNSDICQYYRQAHVLLFLSDRKEGWGAVLNEGMAYGCVPLANIKAGSTSFLIEDGKNGFCYKNKNQLKKKLDCLINLFKNESLDSVSTEAKKTIYETWNGKVGAQRFFNVCKKLICHSTLPAYKSGPMCLEK